LYGGKTRKESPFLSPIPEKILLWGKVDRHFEKREGKRLVQRREGKRRRKGRKKGGVITKKGSFRASLGKKGDEETHIEGERKKVLSLREKEDAGRKILEAHERPCSDL